MPDNQIEAIDRLFQELHDAYTAPMIESFKPSHAAGPQPQQSPPSQNPPYGAGDYFAEGIFYDGSGAYDFQYLDLAAKRYKEDDQWIVKHRGFSIPTACTIARQLKSLIEGRMRSLTWPQTRTSWAFARLRRSSEERRSDLLLMSRGPIVGLRNDSITVGTPRESRTEHVRLLRCSSSAARNQQ